MVTQGSVRETLSQNIKKVTQKESDVNLCTLLVHIRAHVNTAYNTEKETDDGNTADTYVKHLPRAPCPTKASLPCQYGPDRVWVSKSSEGRYF